MDKEVKRRSGKQVKPEEAAKKAEEPAKKVEEPAKETAAKPAGLGGLGLPKLPARKPAQTAPSTSKSDEGSPASTKVSAEGASAPAPAPSSGPGPSAGPESGAAPRGGLGFLPPRKSKLSGGAAGAPAEPTHADAPTGTPGERKHTLPNLVLLGVGQMLSFAPPPLNENLVIYM